MFKVPSSIPDTIKEKIYTKEMNQCYICNEECDKEGSTIVCSEIYSKAKLTDLSKFHIVHLQCKDGEGEDLDWMKKLRLNKFFGNVNLHSIAGIIFLIGFIMVLVGIINSFLYRTLNIIYIVLGVVIANFGKVLWRGRKEKVESNTPLEEIRDINTIKRETRKLRRQKMQKTKNIGKKIVNISMKNTIFIAILLFVVAFVIFVLIALSKYTAMYNGIN